MRNAILGTVIAVALCGCNGDDQQPNRGNTPGPELPSQSLTSFFNNSYYDFPACKAQYPSGSELECQARVTCDELECVRICGEVYPRTMTPGSPYAICVNNCDAAYRAHRAACPKTPQDGAN